MEHATDFIIKREAVEENLRIENVSLDILKLNVNMVYEGTELKPKLELENQSNEHLSDHAYCKVPDTVLYKKETNWDNSGYSVSSVTQCQKEISQMDPGNASNFIIKTEPEEENVKIEDLSLDIPKLNVNMIHEGTDVKPKLEVENQANENLIDHTYCKIPDILLYKKDTNCDNSGCSVSLVTQEQKEISQMDPDNASNFIIKAEPGEENVKIEDVSLDIPKQNVNMVHNGIELKPKLELENQANENLIDHPYCKIPDTLLYKYEELFPSQIEPPVKTEQFEDIKESEQTYEVNFENWDIKNELDIKEEDFKPEENSMSTERVAPDEYLVSITDLKYPQNDDKEPQDAEKPTEHRTKHEKDYPFKCDQCNYRTVKPFCLSQHLLLHADPKGLKCDQCGHESINKSRLKIHQLRHKNPEEVDSLKCPHCNYKTFRKTSLQMHLLLHEPAKKVKTFKCDQCRFRTIYKSYLKEHYTHRHENPDNVGKFRCKQCHFQTIHKKSLRNHVLLHANPEEIERFECYHCSYKTIYKRVLKQHIVLHNRLEETVSFTCDRCGHQTTQKFHVHQRRRPKKARVLRCEQCLYRVNREAQSRVDVVRVPVAVDTFKCHFCDYQTLQKAALRKHLMNHTSSTMFECHQCDYKTVRKDTLRDHVLKHINFKKRVLKLGPQ